MPSTAMISGDGEQPEDEIHELIDLLGDRVFVRALALNLDLRIGRQTRLSAAPAASR